jgi:hypothetical protein
VVYFAVKDTHFDLSTMITSKHFHAIFLSLIFAPVLSQASEYGCKVLLCLSNPNGPTSVAACVPPITQLYDDLRRGRGFPVCEFEQERKSGTYTQPVTTYFDACPSNTVALANGSYALTEKLNSDLRTPAQMYKGIGEGNDLAPYQGSSASLPNKICVGKKIGSTSITLNDGEVSNTYPASIYDRVISLPAQASPRVIDVYVNHQLVRQVRW